MMIRVMIRVTDGGGCDDISDRFYPSIEDKLFQLGRLYLAKMSFFALSLQVPPFLGL